jgi:hypothetical protein
MPLVSNGKENSWPKGIKKVGPACSRVHANAYFILNKVSAISCSSIVRLLV